jgi:hypothetical protein
MPEADVDERLRGRSEDDDQVGRVGDPEDRMPVEQEIADRAAADGRNYGSRRARFVSEQPDGRQYVYRGSGFL